METNSKIAEYLERQAETADAPEHDELTSLAEIVRNAGPIVAGGRMALVPVGGEQKLVGPFEDETAVREFSGKLNAGLLHDEIDTWEVVSPARALETVG